MDAVSYHLGDSFRRLEERVLGPNKIFTGNVMAGGKGNHNAKAL